MRVVAGVSFAILISLLLASATASPAASQHDLTNADTIEFIFRDGALYLSSVYLAQDGQGEIPRTLDSGDLGPIIGYVSAGRTNPADEAASPNEPCL